MTGSSFLRAQNSLAFTCPMTGCLRAPAAALLGGFRLASLGPELADAFALFLALRGGERPALSLRGLLCWRRSTSTTSTCDRQIRRWRRSQTVRAEAVPCRGFALAGLRLSFADSTSFALAFPQCRSCTICSAKLLNAVICVLAGLRPLFVNLRLQRCKKPHELTSEESIQ